MRLGHEGRPIMILHQDEFITKAFDQAKKYWQDEDGGELRQKSDGKGIMASGFLNEEEVFFFPFRGRI